MTFGYLKPVNNKWDISMNNSSPDNESQIQKYKTEPKGIRNAPDLANVCMKCDSRNVSINPPNKGYQHECKKCGYKWYRNNCWNCSNGIVDSRDPETPRCEVCGWYKCAVCGACHLNGCRTNPYNRSNRLTRNTAVDLTDKELEDLEDKLLDIFNSPNLRSSRGGWPSDPTDYDGMAQDWGYEDWDEFYHSRD